jgi:hypothetical protein
MTTRTRTSYYIVHEDHEIEVQHQPLDGTEKVTIIGEGPGAQAVVSYLADDSDGTGGWYFDENEQGEFINFDPRCRDGKHKRSEEEIKELVEKSEGRVFRINKYEHGLVRYYREGDAKTSAGVPDQQWDVSHGCALYIAPEDCPDPAKYCDSVMEEFTDWCNGNIYGVCHEFFLKVVQPDGEDFEWVENEEQEAEACWGFIGQDNATQVLNEEHAAHVKALTEKQTK